MRNARKAKNLEELLWKVTFETGAKVGQILKEVEEVSHIRATAIF